jgi:BON domain/YMGG-like Gly-zipper
MSKNSNRQWVRMWLVLCILGVVACSKTTTTGPTDASIADSLKAAFYSAPELKNDRVDISVNNGEVTLSGEVSSDAARLQAYKLANDTPGVKKITDLLQVKSVVAAQEPPPPLEQPETPPPPAPAPKKTAAPKPKPASAPAKPSPSASSPVPVKPVERPAPAPPPPPPPRVVTVPAGTNLRIQMIDSVDSAKNKAGDTFLASLDAPLTVGDEVVVPKGADVQVKLINSKTSGKFKGQSELELELDRLQFEGNTYNLTSSTYQQVGGSRGKDTVKKTAIGAAIGTAIGAIAGGGKGAAIGAGVGAGGGAASQVFMKGKQVQVPSETKLDFELAQPVEITLKPKLTQ